jgi:glyoxylase I family protein
LRAPRNRTAIQKQPLGKQPKGDGYSICPLFFAIGGFFFRAKDPKALALWYQQHLGILTIPTSDGETAWQQEAGATAFAPFPETSKYFGDAQKVWMLNFRVRDLDKMAAQLQAAGIEVKIDPQSYPYGRFARLHDPEGNPIELWQPAKPAAPR